MKKLLVDLRPDIAEQFNKDKNKDIKIDKLTIGSGKILWWKCSCGYEWETTVNCRARTKFPAKCRMCNVKGINSNVTLGLDDMWTTNPKLASMLLNKEDGYKFKQWSSKKVDWKCPTCELVIKGRAISLINRQGLPCPSCSDGKSYPEKFIYFLLKEIGVEFESEKIFDWSGKKRYDYYIPSKDIVLEVHGLQHYEDRANRSKLSTQKKNDNRKRELCENNGVNYIEIDARISEKKYLENSIKKCLLSKHCNITEENLFSAHSQALNSFTKIIADYWKKGKTKAEIITLTGFSSNTITSYLKKASEAKLCDYTKSKSYSRAKMVAILQYTKEGVFIQEWSSAMEASEALGIDSSTIRKCCNGKKYKSTGGYIWKHKAE